MTDKLNHKPTKSGYIRLKIGTWPNCIQIFEHQLVWEQNFGKLPKNKEIHHINGIKTDNRLENLIAVTRLMHRRIHAGWIYKNNHWYKNCSDCSRLFRVNRANFYFRKSGKGSMTARCKSCHSAFTSRSRNERLNHDRQANAFVCRPLESQT